jgi:hypothetical protein
MVVVAVVIVMAFYHSPMHMIALIIQKTNASE